MKTVTMQDPNVYAKIRVYYLMKTNAFFVTDSTNIATKRKKRFLNVLQKVQRILLPKQQNIGMTTK